MDRFSKTTAKERAASPTGKDSPAPKQPRDDKDSSVASKQEPESNDDIELYVNTIKAAFTSSASTTPPTPVEEATIYPFEVKDSYWCPYMAAGMDCDHRKKSGFAAGEMKSMDALKQHCFKAHDGGKVVLTPHTVSPLEDGTHKIPCPRACPRMFSSYNQANNHDKLSSNNPDGCTMPAPSDIPCPWRNITGCSSQPAEDAKSAANHHRTHEHDERGTFGCSKGCGRYYMNVYLLARHEEKCSGPSDPSRKACY